MKWTALLDAANFNHRHSSFVCWPELKKHPIIQFALPTKAKETTLLSYGTDQEKKKQRPIKDGDLR